MSKKVFLLCWILVLCCLVVGFFGLKLSLRDLNVAGREKCVFDGKIVSYDYNQYTKHSSFYFNANINGRLITLEIPDLYIENFKQEEFKKTFSSNNIYTFVVLQDDYDKYEIIPIVGLKHNTKILLDEDVTLENLLFNAKMGLVFSSLFLVVGVATGFALFFVMAKNGL